MTETNQITFDLAACPTGPLIQMLPEDIRDSFKNFNLRDLVGQRDIILELIRERGGEVSDELETLFELAGNLMAGKVDRLGWFVKEVYPAHRAALKRQIEALDRWEEGIGHLLEFVLRQTPGQRLDGLAWRVQLQKNGGIPRLVIDNAEALDLGFKRQVYELTARLDPLDDDLNDSWASWIEVQKTLTPSLRVESFLEPDNETIRKVLATGEEIPGVRLEQGEHVRFYPGGAKPHVPKGFEKLEKPAKKTKAEKETA